MMYNTEHIDRVFLLRKPEGLRVIHVETMFVRVAQKQNHLHKLAYPLPLGFLLTVAYCTPVLQVALFK